MTIYYTGIGANDSGVHSEDDFLNIMAREFTNKDWSPILALCNGQPHYQLTFNDWVLPRDFILFTLNDWIEYSGAEIVSLAE